MSSSFQVGWRKQQFFQLDAGDDVSRMLGGADERTLQQVRSVVMTYMRDAVEDLENLIYLGKLEYQPVQPKERSDKRRSFVQDGHAVDNGV